MALILCYTAARKDSFLTMKLTDLLPWLPRYRVIGNPEVEVTGIAYDSRRVCPGTLFVAYQGVNVDGHGFISAALKNGAVAIVGEREVSEIRDLALPAELTVPYVNVPDGRQALAWLSAAWHGFPARQLTMIGVTGTDGKTSTVNLIYHILQAAGLKAGMISTVNAVIGQDTFDTGLHTTTPDAPDIQRLLAQMVAAGTEICVLETTSHGLAQQRVAACDFDVAVITNITHEHLDIHGTLEAYQAAKASLFHGLMAGHRKPGVSKTAILNAGDSSYTYLQSCLAEVRLAYNIGLPGDVIARHVTREANRTRFEIHSPYGQFPVETRLPGHFNVFNILAAAATTLSLGVEPRAIQQGIATMRGLPGRMEQVDRGQPFTAIVDFAHTPHSLRRALETVRELAAGEGRVIVVFGCAGLRDVEKRPVMGRIAAELADYTILTAEDPRTEDLDAIIEAIASGCRSGGGVEGKTFVRVPDRGAALAYAVRLAGPGDVVIACGKGHEQSMCFGETEYPWDDRQALAAALEGHPLKTLPTAQG
ncbi:MAG: UDP-N-acetylmuramoyl-L-alanyl-D-glutamate--2,6-diaminopimelate ligase [Anaerolineae bacterium]